MKLWRPKEKGGAFTRRPGSSLRCFCQVEALLPTCCRPWSCRPEWPTRPCRARPRQAPAEAEPTRSSPALSVRRNCRTALIAPPLLGALLWSSFSGAERAPGFRLSPLPSELVPGTLLALGLFSTMVMSLLAPGASSASAAVVPSPKARAVVKRANFSLIESFHTDLGGNPLRRWPRWRSFCRCALTDRGGTCGLERGSCLAG